MQIFKKYGRDLSRLSSEFPNKSKINIRDKIKSVLVKRFRKYNKAYPGLMKGTPDEVIKNRDYLEILKNYDDENYEITK